MGELRLRGEGATVVLRVARYIHLDDTSGLDGNLIAAALKADVGSVGSFRASKAVNVFTADLHRFRDALRTLDALLSGEATLTNFDSDFQITIRLDHGKGTLSGVVLEWGRELRFSDIETDQTFVREALHELDAIVEEFPIRGNPYD